MHVRARIVRGKRVGIIAQTKRRPGTPPSDATPTTALDNIYAHYARLAFFVCVSFQTLASCVHYAHMKVVVVASRRNADDAAVSRYARHVIVIAHLPRPHPGHEYVADAHTHTNTPQS